MEYDKEINGFSIHKEVYFEEFSEVGDDPNIMYTVNHEGDYIDEGKNNHELAACLLKKVERLTSIANFLQRIKVPVRTHNDTEHNKC